MKIINKIDDSHCDAIGERIIYVIELEPNVFIDVMHIVNEDYFYPMDFVGSNFYNNKNEPLDYPLDAWDAVNFVEEQIKNIRRTL